MRSIIIIALLLISQWGVAQKYKSSDGIIKFYSEEVLEDITAINKDVKSIFDSKTGQLVFSVPISSFDFEKSLMQEHFNEKYMETEKYPKATFKGNLTNYKVNQKNPEVWAEGELEVHGVKQHIKVNGSLNFGNNKMILNCVFNVKLVDYNIDVPELMFQKIAEEIEITVDLEYKVYEK